MTKPSIEEFWEMLERHNRFYAWVESTAEYDALVAESETLFDMSQTSEMHSQLYVAYWTATYRYARLGDDGEVQDTDIPEDGMPEDA